MLSAAVVVNGAHAKDIVGVAVDYSDIKTHSADDGRLKATVDTHNHNHIEKMNVKIFTQHPDTLHADNRSLRQAAENKKLANKQNASLLWQLGKLFGVV
jgi:hypothetical protein